MVYYDRKNKASPSQVFFNLHNYLEDYVSNDVLTTYMIFDILSYFIIGGCMFLFVDVGFWWKLLFVLPLMFLEHCVAFVYFYLYPRHRSQTKDIYKIKKTIKKIDAIKEYWDDKDSIDSIYSWSELEGFVNYYRDWGKEERAYLKEVEKEQLAKQNVPTEVSSAQDVRITNLKKYREEIIYYVEHCGVSNIACVINSINHLIDVVNLKSGGVKLISNNLFVYFNELKYILEKYVTLNDENKEKYNETISEIAERLTANIEEICDNIEKFETDDIEVSMNVLLNELKDFKNLEITDTQSQLLNVENEILKEAKK